MLRVLPTMPLRKLVFSCVLLSSLAACDRGDEAGVNMMMTRSIDGVSEPAGRGCILLERGAAAGSAGGGGGGPDYAEVFESGNGHLRWEWWIAKAENAGDPIYYPSPFDGELAASFEEDIEFFIAGEVADIGFSTHDGVDFKVHIWGTEDCEGGLEPPPGA